MIKAIVFDFFGVLTTDPKKTLESTAPTPAARAAISDITHLNDLGRISETELAQRLAEASGQSQGEVKQLFYGAPQLDPAVLALIKRVQGHFKTALLSNAGHFSLDPYWSRAEMEKYFDTIVISAEVGLVKPDPAIYRLVCQRLAVEPSEAIFIDDIPRYTAGAEAIGMTGLVFTSFDQMRRELTHLIGQEL